MAMNNILGLFAQSPLKPLKQLSVKVTECSELLEPFFEASFNHDWDKAEEVRNQIIDLERRADSLKREIRLKLPRGLFLPVERTDLLEIVTQLDKLANYSRDISGRIMGRHLVVPEIMQPAFRQFLFRSLDSCRQVRKVLGELDELLEKSDIITIHTPKTKEHIVSDELLFDKTDDIFQHLGRNGFFYHAIFRHISRRTMLEKMIKSRIFLNEILRIFSQMSLNPNKVKR